MSDSPRISSPEIERLRPLLARKGLSIPAFALLVPCSAMQVRNWLHGKAKPTAPLRTLLALAIANVERMPDHPTWADIQDTLSLYKIVRPHATLEEKTYLLKSETLAEYHERLKALARKIQKRCAEGTPAEAAANAMLKE
jgi:transcriptional regulator with XRE-family HTH domain